jgi:transposase
MTTLTPKDVVVTGGVDTHQDLHVAAALDQLGRQLGTHTFPTTAAGYRQLLAWLRGHGRVERVGVEGTGSYGAALARHLTDAGVQVLEVARPNRAVRRRHGKTDVVDAIAAARAVLSGEATGTPKSHDGPVEALRTLQAVQRSANKARTQALNQIHQLLITAPEELRARLRPLTRTDLLATCAGFRIATEDDSLQAMTRLALRELAQRVLHLDAQLAVVIKRLHRITVDVAPQLVATTGVGPAVASALLITAGDNPHRMKSEAAFAALCGSNPIPASSGKTNRHRLNRGGDRNANATLWRIVIVRLACDERTKGYLARRQTEGKTKTEAIRCLKRYVAREIFHAMPSTAAV